MKIKIEDIEKFRDAHWKPTFGSLGFAELVYVSDLIEKHKPKRFLEVGVASGLTGAIIIKTLAACVKGQTDYVGVDLNRVFWADRTKQTGYLLKTATAKNVRVDLRLETLALQLHELKLSGFNMAFIDANHRHPWPTLDTIVTLPLMAQNSILLHHDLTLFRRDKNGYGPKLLFDQFHPLQKHVQGTSPNIGHLIVPDDIKTFSKALADALLLPWNLHQKVPFAVAMGIGEIIKEYYTDELLSAYYTALERFY